ncbi:hypothetical protein GCM10009745_07630 [Kribbella yunnanensis]|uniref:Nuclear transport factor 2 family protein n=1 Tax=Kribbella yunnanensis TaxID=190194 RepID=A0ABN2G9U2_9ACTN
MDQTALNELIRRFFDAFVSGPDCEERLDALPELFIPQAVIVRTCGSEPLAYTVDEFIAPRRVLLTGGTLTDFREWALDGRFDIFGDIAHWYGAYAKEGRQDGVAFTGRGMKTIQFVRTAAGWRISAAAWDDERPGVVMS